MWGGRSTSCTPWRARTLCALGESRARGERLGRAEVEKQRDVVAPAALARMRQTVFLRRPGLLCGRIGARRTRARPSAADSKFPTIHLSLTPSSSRSHFAPFV